MLRSVSSSKMWSILSAYRIRVISSDIPYSFSEKIVGMLIYITGASGCGKTTVLKSLRPFVPGYDLDDLYEANWKKHRTMATVQKGVIKDVNSIISANKDVVFVGLQGSTDLPFKPDLVILLVRKDYEDYFRQKLVRDLKLLCEGQAEYVDILKNKPFSEFRNYFWSNDVVGMKTLKEFKAYVHKMNAAIKTDFPQAKVMLSCKIADFIRKILAK